MIAIILAAALQVAPCPTVAPHRHVKRPLPNAASPVRLACLASPEPLEPIATRAEPHYVLLYASNNCDAPPLPTYTYGGPADYPQWVPVGDNYPIPTGIGVSIPVSLPTYADPTPARAIVPAYGLPTTRAVAPEGPPRGCAVIGGCGYVRPLPTPPAPTKAPEVDPNTGVAAITLLLGSLVIARGRK